MMHGTHNAKFSATSLVINTLLRLFGKIQKTIELIIE